MESNINRNEVLEKEMKLAEEFFGTADDPEQIPISYESVAKLDKICSGWLQSEFDENNEPISWGIFIPTQTNLAERFLDKEINERQLLDLTQPQETYNALYLASVITVPKHRGKGLATKILLKGINSVPVSKDVMLFAWPISEEGKNLAKKLMLSIDQGIEIRE